MTALRFHRVGERGLLIEVGDNSHVHRLASYLRERLTGQLAELIPGHDTLLAVGAVDRPLEATVSAWRPDSTLTESVGRERCIAVVYDGEDLAEVAAECRMSVREVVRRHQAGTYVVAFSGFAPGFAYLTGGDVALRPSRRAVPRPRVPAGAVALAGEYSAVYPHHSPGGWKLLGRTTQQMFDVTAEPPAYLCPGDRVRFISR